MALNYYQTKNVENANSIIDLEGITYYIEHEITSTPIEGCVNVKSFIYKDEGGARQCQGSVTVDIGNESTSITQKGQSFKKQARVIAQIYVDIDEILNKK